MVSREKEPAKVVVEGQAPFCLANFSGMTWLLFSMTKKGPFLSLRRAPN